MQELNYPLLLDFLNKRKITYILWDKMTKTWIAGDRKGELGRKSTLENLVSDILPIFEHTDRLYTTGEDLYDNYDEDGVQEFYLNDKGNKFYEDMGLFSFLEQKLFNYMWVDDITKNWIIGDFETKMPASYSNNIRNCIKNLIY